jgi:phytoene/squalene synthetase
MEGTTEPELPIGPTMNEKAFYAWVAGTAAFAVLDYYASRGRTTYSMCVRRVFVTKHPAGRAALAAAMVYLWSHLSEDKSSPAPSSAHSRLVAPSWPWMRMASSTLSHSTVEPGSPLTSQRITHVPSEN